MVEWYVAAAMVGSFVFSFAVVPEIFQRRGYDPRSAYVRAFVWLSFLGILLVPAAASGFLARLTTADWLFLTAVMAVAILWEYYRLNISHRPPSRKREHPP